MSDEVQSSSTLKQEIGYGLRDLSNVFVPVAFFGMMFGAASIAAGQTLANTIWASAFIYAGASQFVFLGLHGEGVPLWSVLVAVFAVNFRHVLYSAAIARKISKYSFWQKWTGLFLLTDLQYAVVEARAEKLGKGRLITPAYYFGFGIFAYIWWIIVTTAGAIFGSFIDDPVMIGFDFILPIYFASILMGFRNKKRFGIIILVSAVAAILVQKTIGEPWHISLGGIAGIIAAMLLAGGEEDVELKNVGQENADG